MKKEVKNLYFAVVLGFIFIFLIGLVSATSHTNTCSNPNEVMIKLAQSSNSLGALASDTNFAWDICYDLTKNWPTHGFHVKMNELQMYGLPVKKPSLSILNALDAMKFRLDEAEPFQGFIDGNTALLTMSKIAA